METAQEITQAVTQVTIETAKAGILAMSEAVGPTKGKNATIITQDAKPEAVGLAMKQLILKAQYK